ncbi:energy transducer TonB [Odoribacter sp. OttesenSCG-928-G04]|nr:energy transducer TonB [Odoribacter sp. OttesenSCG-928-G04]MDL2330478.1 energy transducer TonB [Odoribacter sp. OttesenSCG-928-A06]
MEKKNQILEKWQTHKYGIMGTVIFHLLLIISLLSAGIAGMKAPAGIEIELADIPLQELQKRQAEQERKEELRKQTSTEEVQKMLRSIAVNENVQKNRENADEKVQRYVEEAIEEVSGNRAGRTYKASDNKQYQKDSIQHALDKYERMLDSIKSTVYAGESSASYDLDGRFARRMPIPVFKCEYGGKVVVLIAVDRKGVVQKAEIDETQSGNDPCLYSAAKDAALRSLFNEDVNAPILQQGKITFNFVKQ